MREPAQPEADKCAACDDAAVAEVCRDAPDKVRVAALIVPDRVLPLWVRVYPISKTN